MRTALAELLDLMNLEPLGDNRFQGQCQDLGYRRLFSGLMMAQAMSAMMLHMRERGFADWLPHSMHSYFLSSGNTDGTVLLELSETRMGRTYANLQVCVSQDGEKLACVSASFSQPEDGFYHQVSSPQVAGPDGIASQDQLSPQWRDSFPERQRHAFGGEYPLEMRVLNPVNMLNPEPCSPHKQVWLRPSSPMPDCPRLHTCLMVYASAFNMLTTSLQPHGVSVWHENMQCVTLDHSLWFHRPAIMDDWMYYDITSPGANAGRGLSRGELFNRQGELMASVAQESLIRQWPEADESAISA